MSIDLDTADRIVDFILGHYECYPGGESLFTLDEVDPETWWDNLCIRPHEGLLPNSRRHLEARKARWKELVREHLT